MRSWMVPVLSGCPCGGMGWGRTGFQPQLMVVWHVAAPGPPGRAVAQGEAVTHRLSFPTACMFYFIIFGFFPIYFNLYISRLLLVPF